SSLHVPLVGCLYLIKLTKDLYPGCDIALTQMGKKLTSLRFDDISTKLTDVTQKNAKSILSKRYSQKINKPFSLSPLPFNQP
ncbi:MAG: hypothetical protein AAFQ23_13475, partial [Cyanobacteria bacterium J06623_1]